SPGGWIADTPRLATPFPAAWFLEHSWTGTQPETEQPAYSWGQSWMGRQPETEQPAYLSGV
ncbi:MAG: hypothetical protein M3Z66_19140, partial [Chloroflexota bacterium]|nr:hypothetical protein [Chloroflexota bacterium]